MKIFFLIVLATSLGCKCTKNNTSTDKSSDAEIVVKPTTIAASDTLPALPLCIKVLIEKMKSEAVTNPPSKLLSYTFQQKTVYYVPAICCDQYSDLYNDSCSIIAHPDGGFTGKGDRKFPNFWKESSNEKLLWEDKRTK